MQSHTVVLVPSDHFYWFGLEEMLRRQPEVRVVDVAPSRAAALCAVTAHPPAFILVAADLEDAPLVALVRDLGARCPRSKVIAIGPVLGPAEHAALAGLKLAGYLRWEEVSPERLRCILALMRDADVRVARGAAVDLLAPSDRRRRPRARGPALTERDRAVMRGLAAGRTREEIVVEAHLGLRTVKRTIAALCARFDAPTMFVLGMTAVEHGFAPSGQRSWPRRANIVARWDHPGGKDGPIGPQCWPEKPFTAGPDALYR